MSIYQNKADEKYSEANDNIKKRAAVILKEELIIINKGVKKPLTDIQINTVVGTFEMDDEPPSQIYDEYLEDSSIKPIQFYTRCIKSIDEAVEEERIEQSNKLKKLKASTTATAKGRKKRKKGKKGTRKNN